MEQDRQETAIAAPDGGKRRTGWIVAGSVAVLALAGIGAAGAMGGGFGGGPFGHPMMGMMHGGGGPGMGRIFDEIGVSDEQEDRIWAIIDDARAELRPMMREFRDTHGKALELMAAPTIDRAAIEALRADRIAAIDEASKRLTAAVADAAEVLTPEQRAKLAEELKERRGWRRR